MSLTTYDPGQVSSDNALAVIADRYTGKTIQVISFLSAIMKKRGNTLDIDRRRKHVARLQNRKDWKEHRKVPPANATWPTCLIIAPSSVVPNWEREFQTVSCMIAHSGVIASDGNVVGVLRSRDIYWPAVSSSGCSDGVQVGPPRCS